MSLPLDMTDVPTVEADELALPMQVLIDAGRALVLLNGASKSERRHIEAGFWQRFEGDTARGVTILVRFWTLVEVMSTRRMRSLFLNRGLTLVAPLMTAAAGLRLNTRWGFNPNKLAAALQVSSQRAAAEPLALAA